MKQILFLSLLALTFSSFLEDNSLYEYLKVNAPYEIYSPSENPFLNYTDEELHLLFSENIQNPENLPLPEKHSEPLQDFPSSYDFRTEYPKCVQRSR